MNYRHAFHAGNPADCMKHALLVWLLRALHRKPAPVFVLDTHAGTGQYNLQAEAERTGEWRGGIARLLHEPPGPLADYVGLVEWLGLYPGSPALARALLREGDRLACCELHPDDCRALRRWAGRDARVAVHERDGYEALSALLPPGGFARGLVLVDPPYEAPGEFARVADGLQVAARRWNTGVLAAWYPIKHRSPVTTFLETVRLSGLRDVVVAELCWRDPTDPTTLNGCGLLVRNPPWGFEAEAPVLLQALLGRLHTEAGAGVSVRRITHE